MSTSEEQTKPISVKIIETQYVETDATSFKSVVQRLTGKGAAPPPTTVGSGSTGPRHEAREEKDTDRDQRRSSDGGGSKGDEIFVGVPTLDELSKLLGG